MFGALSKEKIDYLFKFVGYGDPKGQLWFVGIEEGGPTGEPRKGEHLPITYLGAYYDPRLPEGTNAVWRICSEIAHACGVGDHYFLANMGPIARPKEKARLTGIDERTYIARVTSERIPMLRKLSEQPKRPVIIFHGKGAWTRYGVRETLGLISPNAASGERVIVYRRERILLTNFFSRRFGSFTKDDQRSVVESLKVLL